jgi:hypothetical protein
VVSDPLLEAHWKKVVDHWDDDAAHRAFIEHCASSEKLAEGAARYRGMTGDRDRGDQAQRRLAAIAAVAMARLETLRTREKRAPSHAVAYTVIALFIAATIGLLAYLQSSVP